MRIAKYILIVGGFSLVIGLMARNPNSTNNRRQAERREYFTYKKLKGMVPGELSKSIIPFGQKKRWKKKLQEYQTHVHGDFELRETEEERVTGDVPGEQEFLWGEAYQ